MLTDSVPAHRDVSRRFAAVALGALVIASFLVRLWLLETEAMGGSFSGVDADGYLRYGELLVQDDGWRWTVKAIRYPWQGRPYLLPPLYPVFLSLFVLVSDAYAYWAAIGQMALNAASVVALFVIGVSLHSRRAGLIAAIIFAFWLPNIWTFALFIQEQLYLPLLLAAFAVLLRATATQASPLLFACAGVAFALAALTRAMPMYFIVPAALGCALLNRDRAGVRQAVALVAGFLVVTGVYSVWLSLQVREWVYIENHAGISIYQYGGDRPSGVPSHASIILQLAEAFARDPRGFLGLWWSYAAALFHVNGDRWLHFYRAATQEGAAAAKLIAHAGIDVPFVATVVLAPFGAVLARRRREAGLLALWVVLVVVLTSLSGAGGVRYRAPIEPHLIALASVVLAGAWRRPGLGAVTLAALLALVAGGVVFRQLPRVAVARANYALQEWGGSDSSAYLVSGRVGVNVVPRQGVLEVRVHAITSSAPARVSFWIDGRHVADRTLEPDAEPVRMRVTGQHPGVHYLEVQAADESGRSVRVVLDLASTIVVPAGS